GPAAKQLEDAPSGRILDVADRLRDWQDTADLVAGPDLVISIDSAVAHLAGALGKPVWLLDRFDSEWRWLPGQNRTDSPWYPSMRIFRQVTPGDWQAVIDAVRRELAALASTG
ncbi:MAG TPA: glycosyltransferase family 9 protein, partial [Acetobacteraceae bacterium]|nr:glycosyltransferase family 9 protein [Acetobacteraceae bacterium]